ncbi:MAG: ABC transporter substrate-binding protein, partial [SAR324 cluster bacterium]|nr:ABC transporter substrate-binding protein [SAR324 cluster bacterium]
MKSIFKKYAKLLLISGSALIFSGSAFAAKTHLTMGMSLEPPHLDPTAGAAAAIDEVVYANVFEGLTRINQNAEVLPALADSWIISSDGLTYTFSLRRGVKFHDGAAFDSSDVVFSLERATAENSTNAQKALFSAITSVEAQGKNIVVVKLKTPTGNFLFNMGWGDAVIVDSASA